MIALQSQIKIPNRKNPIGKKIVYIIVSIFQPFRQSPFILLSNRGMIGVRKGRQFLRKLVSTCRAAITATSPPAKPAPSADRWSRRFDPYNLQDSTGNAEPMWDIDKLCNTSPQLQSNNTGRIRPPGAVRISCFLLLQKKGPPLAGSPFFCYFTNAILC